MTSPYFVPPPRGEDLPAQDVDATESERHVKQPRLLADSLMAEWAHRTDFYVGTNMFVYFSATQAKKHDFRGPDFFVVLGTHRHERKSWVVWEEGGRRPDVVIEVVSETTEKIDREDKMRIYAQLLRVGEYYLYDPFSHELTAFILDRGCRGFDLCHPDANGRYYSSMLHLELGVTPTNYQGLDVPMLRFFRPDGEIVLTDAERSNGLAQRLALVEAENEELRAKLARLEREAKKR